jgi:amino acid transporter
VLICSFLVQYPWLYDFILLQNGRHINLVLRQQMKMFVVAAVIFTVLMYLVYLFAFPINNDDNSTQNGKLFDLYNTLMVFNLISAILVIIQIMTGARRIQAQS